MARIYEKTGILTGPHTERVSGRSRQQTARSGRHFASFGRDAIARHWRRHWSERISNHGIGAHVPPLSSPSAAFKTLDALRDSRERREVRATRARAERRFIDAIAELKAALTFAPDDPALLDDLGTTYYAAREYEQAISTLAPLVKANPDDPRLLVIYGDSLLELQRVDEAIPYLQRAVEREPAEAMPRLALGRAYLQKGDFAAAIPLLEAQLGGDNDGSLHVQLARAYSGVGQKDKAETLPRAVAGTPASRPGARRRSRDSERLRRRKSEFRESPASLASQSSPVSSFESRVYAGSPAYTDLSCFTAESEARA